jgi:hypothetical protein
MMIDKVPFLIAVGMEWMVSYHPSTKTDPPWEWIAFPS